MYAGPVFDRRRRLSCCSNVRDDIFHSILNLTVFVRRNKIFSCVRMLLDTYESLEYQKSTHKKKIIIFNNILILSLI